MSLIEKWETTGLLEGVKKKDRLSLIFESATEQMLAMAESQGGANDEVRALAALVYPVLRRSFDVLEECGVVFDNEDLIQASFQIVKDTRESFKSSYDAYASPLDYEVEMTVEATEALLREYILPKDK